MPKITIDGKTYEVPAGTNVLEACAANGVKLEHFCYHRYLPVAGNCRTCMVEIEGPRGRQLAIACNTLVSEGMVIHSASPTAAQAQKSALEFLLLDHPLDCPVCDKAGECKLQDHYLEYGRYEPRRGVPRDFKGGKAVDLGEHIVLDQERCVLCTRCVRFLDEVPKTSELCIINRGHESVLTTFPGRRLNNPYSGCTTDVCPVGALTLKEFRFQQRVWLLKKTPSVCDVCARGCSITMEHNFNRVWRYMPRENPGLNRSWICDEGRLSFKRHHTERLSSARVQGREVAVSEGLDKVVEWLRDLKSGQVGALASPWAALEDNWVLRKLFRERFDPRDLAASTLGGLGIGDDILRLPEKFPNANGLRLLGIPLDPTPLLKGMESGRLKALILMENDLVELAGEKYQKALAQVPRVILLATHRTAGVETASAVFPVTTHAEKDGTFVNAGSLLQRFHRALDPASPEVMESSRLLSILAGRLGVGGFDFADVSSIFQAMAREEGVLSGWTHATIPALGIALALETRGPAPFQNIRVDPNVVPSGGSA